MSDPIGFYRAFQSLLRGRAIEGVLTSGMACVEYGLQQNTKDTDWIVVPALIERLVTLFGDLERGVSGGNWRISYRGLFGAPLDEEYMSGGWTSHLTAFDEPESAERHLDFFGRPPRVGEAWQADVGTVPPATPPRLRSRPTPRPAAGAAGHRSRAAGHLRTRAGTSGGARGGDATRHGIGRRAA